MEWIVPTVTDDALLSVPTVAMCYALILVVALIESRL